MAGNTGGDEENGGQNPQQQEEEVQEEEDEEVQEEEEEVQEEEEQEEEEVYEARQCGKKGRKHMLKIRGGREARKGEWPWQVAVLNRFKVSIAYNILKTVKQLHYGQLCCGHVMDWTHTGQGVLTWPTNNLYQPCLLL